MIDLYCERTAAGLLAEPLNLVSNLSFIVAAAIALRIWLREPERSYYDLLLILNLFAIGAGSALFHSFASFWSLLADVIPIQTAIVLFYFILFRRIFVLSVWLASLATLAVVALSGLVSALLPAGFLNNSGTYLIPILGLGFAGLVIAWRRPSPGGRFLVAHPVARSLLAACAILLVSLTARALDLEFCARTYGIGLHVIWHLLNGLALGLLIITLIKHHRRQPEPIIPAR